ncbi:MAG TPA: 3'(2'),5'-bisphosphate nucleotidase [Anaerolineae bacterium]|nr:3'(2'),5'-bisphosphate nucleotidase [Anaerolineae bacterium]HID84510.1 3'(2'),5'-bisphosphate nucleotidase [Anaerolineales bacterium]HIQ09023.1 3'(2'),5'-bisphosphate nucleotidase [Anaerolineaceae bacterium]
MILSFDAPEVRFAVQAAQLAASVVQRVQKDLAARALDKGDRSPVTVADFASQAVVAALLERAFPNDVLVAEEDAATLRTPQGEPLRTLVTRYVRQHFPLASGAQVLDWIDRGRGDPGERFWTLDPIDGTKGFLRGDQYAVALALVYRGRVEIGVLACPHLQEARMMHSSGPGTLALAVYGLGAWWSDMKGTLVWEPLQVSRQGDPSQARILRSFESGHTNADQVQALAEALGVTVEPVCLDSQAKYVLLAAGEGEIYVRLLSPQKPDYKEKIWDQAAGSLIIQEAGGQVTDLDGRPLNFRTGRSLTDNRGVVATNGVLHRAALEALRRIGA